MEEENKEVVDNSNSIKKFINWPSLFLILITLAASVFLGLFLFNKVKYEPSFMKAIYSALILVINIIFWVAVAWIIYLIFRKGFNDKTGLFLPLIVLIFINFLMLSIFFDISKLICGYTNIIDFAKTRSCSLKIEQNLQDFFEASESHRLNNYQPTTKEEQANSLLNSLNINQAKEDQIRKLLR